MNPPSQRADSRLWLAQMQLLRDETYKPLNIGPIWIPSGATISAIGLALLCLAITFGTTVFWYCLCICVVKVLAYLTWTTETRRFSASPNSITAARRFSKCCLILAAITGFCWSLYSVTLFTLVEHTQWLYYAIFAGTLVAAVCSAALVGLSLHSAASAAFLTCAMVPFGIVLLSVESLPSRALGIASILYAATLFTYGLSIKASHIRSLTLRTENRDLLARYQQAKERAEDSDRAKSRFLAAASHDLRQPMQSMSLLVEMLERTGSADERRALVKSLTSSTNTLREMLTLILDIASIDAGTINIEKRAFALQELIDTVVNDFRPAATAKGLVLETNTCVATVFSDPQLLHRILLNLTSNAVKFTEHGTVSLTTRELDEDTLLVEVSDTGTGIAQDKLDLIFEEYYQLDNKTRTPGSGVGLGLAIAAGLAKLMGHILSVKSSPAHGSTFSIELSRSKINVREVTESGDPVPKRFQVAHRVLIVDDDIQVADALRQLLNLWGLDTRVANSYESVRSIIHSGFIPALALVDLRLQEDKNGVDVLQYLQNKDNTIEGIILTGDTAMDYLETAIIEGYPLLHKPVKPSDLFKNLNKRLTPKSVASDDLEDTLSLSDW